MPRYLGVLWPAGVISAATLLLRLPTRTLRCLAIALLLGINLLRPTRHLRAGEAPIDQMARDVLDMARLESHLLTYNSR